MSKSLELQGFLEASGVILDVRSPSEFAHAHIPGALSLPLFTNEERALVGTCYKQKGRDEAVHLGLQLVGPKFADMVTKAKELLKGSPAKVHCWRGGMRSGAVAWLLETAGIPTVMLAGGYKAFRRYALNVLSTIDGASLIVLGGLTGCGKTEILHALTRQGEQVLDLEGIACHRGSSYGMLGMPPQPSCEQFENTIALQWGQFDLSRPVWVEDESRMIGCCKIPDHLFQGMQDAPLVLVERSVEERLQILERVYGQMPKDELISATRRIERRLGGAMTQQVCGLIAEGNLSQAFEKILTYYDKAYEKSISKRQNLKRLSCESLTIDGCRTVIAQNCAN